MKRKIPRRACEKLRSKKPTNNPHKEIIIIITTKIIITIPIIEIITTLIIIIIIIIIIQRKNLQPTGSFKTIAVPIVPSQPTIAITHTNLKSAEPNTHFTVLKKSEN
jgi:hypothetical protein